MQTFPVTFGFDRCPDLRVWAPKEWVVLEEFGFTALNGDRFVIPKWFISDLASLPAPVRMIYNVNDESRAPAILHDFLYCSKMVSRERADALLREAMLSLGSSRAKAFVFHSGVRAGGWVYWNKRDGSMGDDYVPSAMRKRISPPVVMVA